LKLKQVEQKVLEYLHNSEPKTWEEVVTEPEPSESQEVKD
jgi:hypothetical protein